MKKRQTYIIRKKYHYLIINDNRIQNIEYKQSWRDEYQKWICGFANAQGGTIFIGIDDDGEVCGVENAKRLMEEIPNKVRDMMGITNRQTFKLKTKATKI